MTKLHINDENHPYRVAVREFLNSGFMTDFNEPMVGLRLGTEPTVADVMITVLPKFIDCHIIFATMFPDEVTNLDEEIKGNLGIALCGYLRDSGVAEAGLNEAVQDILHDNAAVIARIVEYPAMIVLMTKMAAYAQEYDPFNLNQEPIDVLLDHDEPQPFFMDED